RHYMYIFFFSLKRQPTKSTLFPYTTLFRSAEYAIESVVLYNRTEEDLGKRLGVFTLIVLDKDRKVVFERQKLPAPDAKITTLRSDRKSTRLNSSHVAISYAVFCLKKTKRST